MKRERSFYEEEATANSASCVGFVVKSGHAGNRNLEPRINIMIAATYGPDCIPDINQEVGGSA